MTDGLRKSHLRKAPQVGLSEVGLPEGNQVILVMRGRLQCYMWGWDGCDGIGYHRS